MFSPKAGLKQAISRVHAPRIFLEVTEELTTTYTVEVYRNGGWEAYLLPSNLSEATFTDRETAEQMLSSIV